MLDNFSNLLQIRPGLQQLRSTIQRMVRGSMALHGVFREVGNAEEDHELQTLHLRNGSLPLLHLHPRPLARWQFLRLVSVSRNYDQRSN
jgi:hypothetical protein